MQLWRLDERLAGQNLTGKQKRERPFVVERQTFALKGSLFICHSLVFHFGDSKS
jgi:hypothetical protein